MELFRTLLVCLLAVSFLAVVTPSKHHRHHREYDEDDDEDSHYLPPESHELKPFFRKDKHTSEHVTYHKGKEEHHDPKRVDHYHHYDKKPEVKTKHIHYQQPIPQVRTAAILTAAPSQIVTRRLRPNRVSYATAPNSVFHTQINVQSQDSQLSSEIRPDPLVLGGQLPVNAQAPTGAQLGTSALPNCQFPVAGNAPVGCRVFDPLGDQLGTGALPAGGGQLPGNGLAPGGGQLPTNGLAPGGGQQPANGFAPAGGQLVATGFAPGGGQQLANGFQAGGQLGNGNNFFVDPSQGAQLGAGLGIGNGNQNGGFGQNLFVPANGRQFAVRGQVPVVNGGQTITQRPSAVLIQFDPALGGQLPASAQAPAAGNPFLGAQLGTGQAPAPQQAFPANAAPLNPVLGGQLSTGAQAPANGNGIPNPNQFNPVFGAQLATSAQAPGNVNLNQVRLNTRRRNRRQRNRSNYQGLNVVRGNVFGQPNVQGPTNAVGNQQDTNIIDGNFYSRYSGLQQLQRINGNQRSVFLTDGDYYDDDDDGTTTDIGFAGSAPELAYAKPEPKRSSHKGIHDQETSASEHHETEYHDDGYHYKNPRRNK